MAIFVRGCGEQRVWRFVGGKPVCVRRGRRLCAWRMRGWLPAILRKVGARDIREAAARRVTKRVVYAPASRMAVRLRRVESHAVGGCSLPRASPISTRSST